MGQTGKNVVISLKEQAGLGQPAPSGAGALGLEANADQGMQLQSNPIQSGAIRRDGTTKLGRLGSYSAAGQYSAELRVGDPTIEALLAAGMRGTWAAGFALDEGDGSLGAITIANNEVTAAGGSWITQGLRAGHLVMFTGLSATADNGIWHRVVEVTASKFTVADVPGLTAANEAEWDLDVARHLVSDDPPTERYHTVEEYLQDIDESLLAEDVKVGGFSLSVSADQHIVLSFPLVGTDLTPVDSGSAPHFTSPTFATSEPLVLLDGSVRVLGEDVVDLTDFSLTLNPNPQVMAVLGQRKSPDVFMGNAAGEGSVSGILNDLANLTALRAETNLELFLVAAAKGDPSEVISIYVGNCAWRGHQKPFGGEGAMIETQPFAFGVDETGAGRFPSMLVISTSAAGA